MKTIILVRHGKPASATNEKTDIVGYARWLKRYKHSKVSESSKPSTTTSPLVEGAFLISSDLPRAMHSCEIVTDKQPTCIDSVFREMDVPWYRLPHRFEPMTWVYISRLLWHLGFKGKFESFKEAKQRIEVATDRLESKLSEEDTIALFGHGYTNRYIRKSLIKRGWQLVQKDNNYWGVTQLVKVS